jgi:hypothetical protein
MEGAVIEIVAAIVIPALAFTVNWSVRASKGYALSAAADFILAISSFDLAALVAHDTFEKIVREPWFHQQFITIFVSLFCITMILWLLVIMPLEHRMSRNYSCISRNSI